MNERLAEVNGSGDDVETGGCASNWETGQVRGGYWWDRAGEAKRRGRTDNDWTGVRSADLPLDATQQINCCRYRNDAEGLRVPEESERRG